MEPKNSQPNMDMIKSLVDPWYQSLSDPANAQEKVLQGLLKGYSQTDYGKQHKSERVGSYADYKKAFPVQTYGDFKPFIDEVMAGNTHAFLSEAPLL